MRLARWSGSRSLTAKAGVFGTQSGGPGTVDANVFRRSVDYAEEFAVGLHLVLGRWDCGSTVRRDQVKGFGLP